MVQDHSSLFKPTKRPRQVTRRESQAPTFPLFQLPTELVSYILDLVTEAAELEALSWSCRTFYRACRKRALLARFSVVAPLQRNVHCFEGAQPGELGYKPFSIISCSRAENGTDVRMRAAEHNVTRFEREGQTLQHLLIQWTEAEVYLRHVCRYCLSNSSCHNQVTFSWNKQARGRLLKMNSAMMDSRFDCLECGSSRLVAYGSEEIEDRWEDLTANLFPLVDAPCPRCTVSYEEACAIHYNLYQRFLSLQDNNGFSLASLSQSTDDGSHFSSTSSSRCSSVSSSNVDENDYPPRLYHGDSDEEADLLLQSLHGGGDAEGDELDFPPSIHSDLSDAESTEYASIQYDNIDDDSSSDELDSTSETALSIDFEAELQQAKRVRELERLEFEWRGWGHLTNERKEFDLEEEMTWEEQDEEELALRAMDHRPEGPLWVEGYAYDYGNGWLWAPTPMQAYRARPRNRGENDGRWTPQDEEESSVADWNEDARAGRRDWY